MMMAGLSGVRAAQAPGWRSSVVVTGGLLDYRIE
jgi:hypothetical protein